MKSPTYLLALVLLLAGCSKGGGQAPDAPAPKLEGIEGVWVVDVARLGEQPSLQAMPEERRELALEMARSVVDAMSFEFSDGAYTIHLSGRSTEGSYTIASQTPEKVVLKTREGDEGPEGEMSLVFGEGGVVLHAGDEAPLPLTRKE